MTTPTPPVVIEPWADGDLDLLRQINTPEMTHHLGGPEDDERILLRHQRYVESRELSADQMFRIVIEPDRTPVGLVGYWERDWQDEAVYECGWSVLIPYQGRGIASAAVTTLVATLRSAPLHQHLHAFPSIANDASNVVCRKVGFELVAVCELEYPPGQLMLCNNWRLALH